MRRRLIGMLWVLGVTALQAQTFDQKIQSAVASGRLQSAEALRLEATRLLTPERLPQAFAESPSDLPDKCSTGLIYRLRQAHARGALGSDPLYKSLVYRPVTQVHYLSPGGWFRLHYDLEGSDAPDTTDSDGSGVYDYIEAMGMIFDYVYEVEVNQMGLLAPPDDGNVDGPEWDVYVRNISSYGWTNFETELEDQRWTSYIEMDNDYKHTPTKGLDGVRVTAAHEFFHMIQLGYIGRDDDNDGGLDDLFLMEAGATWMEDVVYDDVNDYYNYLPMIFQRDNTSFDTQGMYMYGMSLWFHYLQARQGTVDVGRQTWEALKQAPALEALDHLLSGQGQTLAEEMARFYGWNYLTGSRADEALYYPEGSHYPQINPGTVQSFNTDYMGTYAVANKAARYLRFESGGTELVLAVTNAQWREAMLRDSVKVVLSSADRPQGFTDLGSGFYGRVGTPEVGRWYGAGFTPDASLTLFDNTLEDPAGDETIPPFPNPFLPEEHRTTRVILPEQYKGIGVTVYNVTGQRVVGETLTQGQTQWQWDGRDDQGRRAASGVYIIVAQVGSKRIYREKVLLIR